MIDKNDSFWCNWNSDPFCEREYMTYCINNDCPDKDIRRDSEGKLKPKDFRINGKKGTIIQKLATKEDETT